MLIQEFVMFEIGIGMAIGALISIVSIYLTLNHIVEKEHQINGNYKVELKNGYNFAAADVKLTKVRKNKNGSK